MLLKEFEMQYRSNSNSYLQKSLDLQGNAGQLAAYESQGHCVVLAGPGSGKTKTLTLKLARMLAEDVDFPQGVACITYSQECARELNRRLEGIGVGHSSNLFVGTVHGFCLRHIVMPYAHLTDFSIPYPITLATKQQMNMTFRRASEKALGIGQPNRALDMSRYRRTHLDRRASDWNTDPDLVKVIEEYESDLRRQGLIDFDDLVVFGNMLVSNYDWALPLISAKFPILMVDEYQDLGVPLHRIVMRLAFNGGVRLFAVGDADQSIYGFNGADGNLLLQLSEKDDVEAVRLQLNYRSAGRIIRASEMVLQEARGYQPSDTARRATIEFIEREGGLEDQATYAVNHIIPAVLREKPARTLGDVAILYRTAEIGNAVADAAAAAGMDYIRVDNAAPYRKVELTSWVEDCAAWCAGGWREGKPKLKGLIDRFIGFQAGSAHEKDLRVVEGTIVSFLMENRVNEGDAGVFVTSMKERLVDVWVANESSMLDQYEEFLHMQEALLPDGALEGLDLASLGGRDGSPKHLNLLTLHSAKGCEYDVVIMIGMDLGNMPWRNESGDSLLESRRLFYVGLTRAKDSVYMLYSGWVNGRFGRQNLGPSPFIIELKKRLREVEVAQ